MAANLATPNEPDLPALRQREAGSLLQNLTHQRGRLLHLAGLATQAHDFAAATAAEKAVLQNLSVVGKLVGSLVDVREIRNVNLFATVDYVRLREAFAAALRRHPEALRDVSAALMAVESAAVAGASKAACDPPAPVIEALPAPAPPPPPPPIKYPPPPS